MSNTKGSMLISNANAVGTELVNQLGGTGYKPSEWSDAINLLGISDDDKASALASITEGTYTGTERGAIKYSNCNAVGVMLNKKFSTNRGFKPVEWESAISKLTPLAEGTVSGSVVSIENGADDVPTKSIVVTIPPTLSGVSAVTETQTGRNLVALNVSPDHATVENGVTINTQTSNTLNMTTTGVAYACERLFYALRKGTYTARFLATSSDSFTPKVALYKYPSGSVLMSSFASNKAKTFTLTEDTVVDIRLFASGNADTTIRTVEYTNFQLEVGSTATAYEPYQTPTQYTASLGRTIYGGTADIVNGTGTDENGNDFTFTGQEVPTRLGYNAFWSDEGDTEVTYRKDPDIPDQPVQLLNMNNENNENNDN